jgi:carboxyl-terminal processing protease
MSNSSKIIIIAAIIIAAVIGFGGGFITSQAANGIGIFQFNKPAPTDTQAQANIKLIDEAWQYLQKEYVEPAKLDSANLSAGAIRGILAALADPHMAYLTASDFKFLQSQFSGSFEGIGAVLGQNDKNQLIIVSVMKGTPAEKSGILAGDIIQKVNGESTEGMTTDIAVSKIRGSAGTKVTLTVLHPDATASVDITITRAQVDVASVNLEMKGDIAVITISQFTSRTEDELAKVLPQLKQNNAQGIIVDLRNNPGGILDIVIQVASHFVTDGVIVSVRSNQGVVQTYKVDKRDITTDLPMVVLVNENSASGSEVLSGALQDHHRALIAGTTTYGKGSVNVLQPLSDGSGIYITISRWLTPDGRLIEGKGIEPDIALTITGDAELQWAIDYLHGTPNSSK